MYIEDKVLPNTLGGMVAFSMFKTAIMQLLQVIFCDFFEIFLIFNEGNRL
jgi:hypothetical protein